MDLLLLRKQPNVAENNTRCLNKQQNIEVLLLAKEIRCTIHISIFTGRKKNYFRTTGLVLIASRTWNFNCSWKKTMCIKNHF